MGSIIGLMWVFLRREWFSPKHKPKILPKAKGPFLVLKRINNNAYKPNFPREYEVSSTFNMADLSPYLKNDTLVNLRENSTQQGEDDGDQAT